MSLHNEPGAIELAGQIARKEFTALEACEAAILRIEKLDGPINAVVVRDFDRAREAAKAVDAGKVSGPLAGVPMTVKESFNIAGLPTTWGFEDATDYIAKEDACSVRKLKDAGAVILGKTNVPVALADLQSVNPVYGRTNNPHDLSRVPGGSSGGAAAALASGMVPLEFGSDIGGSIRTPCHFCGVIGLKPSRGAISSDGHYFPRTEGAEVPLAMTGPLARTTQDIALALDLTARLPLPRALHDSLKGAKILVIDEHPLAALDSSIKSALSAAADAAANAGAQVERNPAALPDLEMMQGDYIRMLNIAISGRFPPDGAPAVSAPDWFEILDKQAQMTRHWAELLSKYDAIFTPVFGTTAFPHDEEADITKRTLVINGKTEAFAPQFSWIGLATYPGLPSISVPVGEDDEGLPIGIQVITPHWQDHSAIALADHLQHLLGINQ